MNKTIKGIYESTMKQWNWLVWSQSLFCPFACLKVIFAAQPKETLSFYWLHCGEKPSESGQFQELPEAIWSCLTYCLRGFSQDGMFQQGTIINNCIDALEPVH